MSGQYRQVSVLYDPAVSAALPGLQEFADLLIRGLKRSLKEKISSELKFRALPRADHAGSGSDSEILILLSPGDWSGVPDNLSTLQVDLAPESASKGNRHSFFEIDPKTGSHRLLSSQGPDAPAFFLALQALAQEINALLGRGRENKSGKGKVFLAWNEALRAERNQLKWELEHFGYEVVPDFPHISSGPQSEDQLRKVLSETELAIHLIHQDFKNSEDGEGLRSPFLQNSIAAEESEKTGLKRLIWIPPGVDISSGSPHRELVRFRDNAGSIAGAEIYQEPVEGFKRTVLEFLRTEKQRGDQKEPTPKEEEGASVYLVHPREANGSVSRIEEFFRSQNIRVWTTGEGSSLQNRRNHHKYLQQCDGVLILYSKPNPVWLETKINDIRKATGLGRNAPIHHRAILHPADTDLPQWEGLPQQFHLLNWKNKKDLNLLHSFSQLLKKDPERHQ